jgi:hypothetical protein
VSAWAERLSQEVENDRRRPTARPLAEMRPAERALEGQRLLRLEEDESKFDLVSRGLDPEKPRRFKGRISLSIRCKPRGHELAHVYPTRVHPVLVPVVSALPIGPNGEKEQRAQAAQRQREIADLHGFELVHIRDGWIEDDDHPDGHPYIRGMAVLSPDYLAPREVPAEYAGTEPALFLLCRCGQRYLYLSQLSTAIRERTRILSV